MNRNTAVFLLFFVFGALHSCQTGVENKPVATEQEPASPRIAFLNEEIAKKPQSADLLYQRGIAFLEAGLTNDAIKDLYAAIYLDSTKSEYFIELAEIYIGKNDPARAIRLLEQSLEIQPESVNPRLQLAKYQFYLQDYNTALKNVNDVLRKEPFYSRAYFLKGMIYKELPDTLQALSSFKTAVEQDPQFYDAYIQLGLLYTAQKNKFAPDYFNNALRIQPNSQEALYNRAYSLQVLGRTDEALEGYKKVIEVNPFYAQAFFNSGYIWLERDSIEKAYNFFNIAVNTEPTWAEAYYMRGLTAEAKGDLPDARHNYQQTLNLDRYHELATTGLARVKAQISQ